MATIDELRQKLIDAAADAIDRAADSASRGNPNSATTNLALAKGAAEALALVGVPRGGN